MIDRVEPKLSFPDTAARTVREIGAAIEADYAPKPGDVRYLSKDELDRLAQLEVRLNDKLFDIADLLTKLNYGNMITFADGVGVEAKAVFEWAKGYLDPQKPLKDEEPTEPKTGRRV